MKYLITIIATLLALGVTARAYADSCTCDSSGLKASASDGSTALQVTQTGPNPLPAATFSSAGGYGLVVTTTNNNGKGALAGEAGTGFANGTEGYSRNANASGIYGWNDTPGWAVYAAGNMGYTGSLSFQSDARLKTQVESVTGALDSLMKLRGVTFHWKDPADHGGQAGLQYGFIAQEIEVVFPSWVHQNKDGIRSVTADGFAPVLVESVKELKAQNDDLRRRVDTLERRRNWGLGFAMLGLALGAVFIRRR